MRGTWCAGKFFFFSNNTLKIIIGLNLIICSKNSQTFYSGKKFSIFDVLLFQHRHFAFDLEQKREITSEISEELRSVKERFHELLKENERLNEDLAQKNRKMTELKDLLDRQKLEIQEREDVASDFIEKVRRQIFFLPAKKKIKSNLLIKVWSIWKGILSFKLSCFQSLLFLIAWFNSIPFVPFFPLIHL